MRAEYVLVALAIGFGVIVVLVTIVNFAFYIRLKRHEHDTWVSLGSPMPFVNLYMSDFARVRSFLREGRHTALSDGRSASLGSVVVVTDRIFLGYIAIACLCVAYIVLFVEP